ncbi:MAG: hypothetical protein IJ775_03825 [Muribaculaceae bacterium]|nr:hypothetical protein [Muribaculaceae bacterium]
MKRKFVIGVLAVALLAGCRQQQAQAPAVPLEVLQEGDLGLRRGSSVASNIVVMMDSDATYSHVGIVARRAGEWVVVHAVPDERDDGGVDTIKADPVATFFQPSRAQTGAIARLDADRTLRQAAAQVALAMVASRKEFDHDYDWTDTTRLYCTQLVQQCYAQAGIDVTQGHQQRVDAPGFHGWYVFPSDLMVNPKMRIIYEY